MSGLWLAVTILSFWYLSFACCSFVICKSFVRCLFVVCRLFFICSFIYFFRHLFVICSFGCFVWHFFFWVYFDIKFHLIIHTYIVEGIPTIIMGLVVLLLLPNSPQDAKFVTEDDIVLLHNLQAQDHQMQQLQQSQHTSKDRKRKEVIEALTASRNWLLSMIGFSVMITSGGVSAFLPSMVCEER
jgi:hypothetical protein